MAAVLLLIFGLNGCGGGGGKSTYWPNNRINVGYSDSTVVLSKPTKVTIVIENSGSMASYYATDYKGILNSIVSFKSISDNSRLFIGNTKEPANGFVDDVINQMVRKHNFTTTTKIHEFLDSALKQVGKGTELWCFVTDGIMSVDKGDMSFKLTEVETTIKKAFSNKKNVATAVFRYKGNFKGGYWTATNGKVMLPACQRPYYVIVVGKREALQWLSEQPKSDLNNYEAAIFMGLYDYTANNTPIITKTYNAVNIAAKDKVSIRIDYSNNRCLSSLVSMGIIKAENIELYDDVKGAPVDKEWYTVKVNSFIEVTINDNKKVQQLCGGKTELTLSVRMPNTITGEWLGSYSTDDDSKMLTTVGGKKTQIVDETTTFGLANLVRGMYNGLQSQEFVFNVTLKFKR